MATIQGWRIVKRPDYSSLNPEFEGSVLTPPGASVTEPVWVWSDWRRLALISAFSGAEEAIGDGLYHNASKPLLAVHWDDADVLETVAVDGGYRYLVAACEIVDPEFALPEAAALGLEPGPRPRTGGAATLWRPGDRAGSGDTDARPGYYDGVLGSGPAALQSGRRIYVAAGATFPATVGDEVGYMQALSWPYGFDAVMAARGL